MLPLRSWVLAAGIAAAPSVALLAQGGGAPPAGRGGGPPPGPPKNVQVLPKDWTTQQVGAFMRNNVAAGLGVRCEYCHIQVAGPDGRQVDDRASDSLETKRVARAMMKMVNEVNGTFLANIGRPVAEQHLVTCETCHHGIAKPRTIAVEMSDAIAAKGADSAIALDRDLRTRYFGRAAYDFGEAALPAAAQRIAQATPDKRPAAIALLKLNLEFFPNSGPTYGSLATMLVASADTAGAVEALNKAISLQPDNPQLKAQLNRLKPPPPPDQR